MKLRPAVRIRSATSSGGRTITYRSACSCRCYLQTEPVQRTGCCVQMKVRQMQVNRGLFEIAMAKQDLNGSQVCSGLQQMRSEAVAQSVRMNVSAEPGTFGGFPACLPHHFGGDWPLARMPAVTGE